MYVDRLCVCVCEFVHGGDGQISDNIFNHKHHELLVCAFASVFLGHIWSEIVVFSYLLLLYIRYDFINRMSLSARCSDVDIRNTTKKNRVIWWL